MKIVIDIPDQKYKWIIENPQTYADELHDAIRNGTPLPEHHGRLIDGDKAIADFANYGIDHMWDATDLPYIIDESPTIIDADKESDTE